MEEKTKDKTKAKQSSSPEQIAPEEALRRMKNFTKRKEKIVAAVRKSEN